MELNNIQLNILNQIYSHRSTYIISGRQFGTSSTIMAFAMREAIDCYKTIGVMTPSVCFYRWHGFMKEHTPDIYDYVGSKKNEIRFINGGKILLCSTLTGDSICGRRFDIFIIDNIAIFNLSHDFIRAISISMSNEFKFVVTSMVNTGDFEFERYGFHRYYVNEESKYYKRKIKHFIKNLT